MKLNLEELKQSGIWKEKGYELPWFNIAEMHFETRNNPEWIHFGGGNIFRAFPACICQKLLNKGVQKTGIIVAEGFDYEIIERIYKQHDNLSILAALNPDGSIEKTVIASVAEALCMDTANTAHWSRLTEIFRAPSLKMASFTITEKGYSLINGNREYTKEVIEDFEHGPFQVVSYMGKLTALCYERFMAGELPLTLVSMDNCSHNGTRLKEAVLLLTEKWIESGRVDARFLEYMKQKVTYPWTMIDKITPRPSKEVEEYLLNTGVEDIAACTTERNTYCAPFVNAEKPQYLVIEEDFAGGRPFLEMEGVIFTTRDIVDKVEKMKVCTCLNPLHTALAIFGCLLGYQKISEEMKDEELKALVYKIGYEEGLPAVKDPGIIRPEQFLSEVLTKRLPNPFIPDTPQRIACDTSQKLGIRFGETIKAYGEKKKAASLTFIPLVLAGWCRYLMGIDDEGNPFTLSADPVLVSVTPLFQGVKLGKEENVHDLLKQLLGREDIFGVNLYQVGLGERIEGYFSEMKEGQHAIRSTLKKYLRQE
ncbi:mannitol dehydrogenase family protein [Anaerocolumna xylanovorans]|uniref:Fructuronate reductase n=1 Tax=Anaerocolumna xylanovorans DSM 12503 TaxID=1121345 RepID=A0A1M7YEU0_9FIRM|nr:mannitol dehydrogenase family protein [Anaerocolumna xylanovorans]SHO51162.1 fructuronate reductase [Anaerocolumna xylanovorans DSM 12503]